MTKGLYTSAELYQRQTVVEFVQRKKKETIKLNYFTIMFLYVRVSDLSLLSTCLVLFLPCEIKTDCL